jgi:Mn-dependent DtxR family transcriptional regulator
MSKMGQTIFEIQELYYSGASVPDIAKATKTSPSFVSGIVVDLEKWRNHDLEIQDYPEPEPDF